jgi:DNA-binding LacI/PurR family transcriptional regulator
VLVNHRDRPPGMVDVARLAGVSHQTVSRVLNGDTRVRAENRERVLRAVSALGYRVNRVAQELVTGRSRLVGVIALHSTLYGPLSTLAALEVAAAAHGLSVSVRRVREPGSASVAAAVEGHLDQRVAGIVAVLPVRAAAEVVARVPESVPVVAVDSGDEAVVPRVVVDHEAGGHAATAHLLGRGHATVWHVAGPQDWYDARGRSTGWRRALEEAGAHVPPVIPAGWTAASGYQAGRVLARIEEATAVFAANDHVALGILRALHEHGRRVPEDVSVVGFDDTPEAAHFFSPLTTVRVDHAAVAAEALALLVSPEARARPVGCRRVVVPELVERRSVAAGPRCPPRRDGAVRLSTKEECRA